MVTRGNRIRGVLLIVLGTGLAIGMSMLLAETYVSMEPALQRQAGGPRFTGTPEQGSTVLTLFTALFVLGIVFALYGLFMAITGRQSRVMQVIGILLLIAMMGAALFVADAPRLIGSLF